MPAIYAQIRIYRKPCSAETRQLRMSVLKLAGFLVSEGVVFATDQVAGIRYRAGAINGVNTHNIVDVVLAPGVQAPDASLERSFYTTSSCGLCGKASLEAVRTTAHWSVDDDPLSINTDALAALP